MRPFVLHAHFYQPERLNPWTGALDPEPSAAPDRDWNERILRECYRPNGTARIFDGQRRVERIVNNYERLSFNFGPTLLAWMEQAHPDAYARIIDGDRRSTVSAGHGNALAQAFNHMILPLANDRDRRTQILWGLADFRHRFGREAEGMWLPETAADRATIDALIDAGVGFTVLAPRQAARVRRPGGDWDDVGESVDTGRPYRHPHSDGSGRSLAVFLYDGGLAQGFAFDPAMADTAVLLERVAASGASHGGLISAALDGETFGHHHHFGELGLAYALFEAAETRDLRPTSYAAYLAEHPPVDELEIVGGEGTAWSCAHGVGRWYRDCGCATDSLPTWNQEWRTPLRRALDTVRDAAIEAFELHGADLLKAPWAARDDYIGVRLGSVTPARFLQRHGLRDLGAEQQTDLWSLLEAQRHAMVMYTSCGWFFADVSGIETVYVLRSALRVLELLAETGVATPDEEVLDVLALARSNKAGVGTGADVWRSQVEPAAVRPTRVAAHLALVGLVRPLRSEGDTAGHHVRLRTHRREQRGHAALSTAHMTVTSLATGRAHDYAVAATHLGGLDLHGAVAPLSEEEDFTATAEQLWTAFPTAPVARLLRLIGRLVHGEEFGIEQLLPDGRQEVVGAVFSDLAERFGEQYSRLYHDHRRILEMLTEAGYDLPRELRAPAELTLAAELDRRVAEALPAGGGDIADIAAVREIIAVARAQGYALDLTPLQDALTRAVTHAAVAACASLGAADAATVERWLTLCGDLQIDVDLSRAQEHAYEVAARARAGRLGPEEEAVVAALGQRLGLSPVAWSATGR